VARTFADAVRSLELALVARDTYTGGHSARVSRYTVAIARRLGLSTETQRELVLAAELHDVGKIGVPDEVLRKNGKLTDEEYRCVQAHPAIGEQILRALLADHPMVLAVVRWHHERIDGAGYPDGLKGEEIPLSARIVAVADTFDAMTSERPYRPALSIEAAVQELRRVAGTHLDAACVEALLAGLSADPALSGTEQVSFEALALAADLSGGTRWGSAQAVRLLSIPLFRPAATVFGGAVRGFALPPPDGRLRGAGVALEWHETATPGPKRASPPFCDGVLTNYGPSGCMRSPARH
jgi:hypothetical protein